MLKVRDAAAAAAAVTMNMRSYFDDDCCVDFGVLYVFLLCKIVIGPAHLGGGEGRLSYLGVNILYTLSYDCLRLRWVE